MKHLKLLKRVLRNFNLKSKKYYYQNYVETNFEISDLVTFEEYHHPNTRKLSQNFNGPYQILKNMSHCNIFLNFKIFDDECRRGLF